MNFNILIRVIKMLSNEELKKLHFQRLERMKPTKVDKAVGPDEEFSCAVCYTNGEESGLVTPKCCSHKICLACYTEIVILHKKNAKCPECRTFYSQNKVAPVEQDDEYATMPPLINWNEIHWFNEININNLININISNHINNQHIIED